MATYGVATQSASEQIYMYSPVMNGLFYNSAGSYQYNAAISSTGFTAQYAIATPTQGMYSNFTSGAPWNGTVGTVGSPSATGTYFYQPTAYENGSNASVYPPNVAPLPAHVYTFGVPSTTISGYGFFAYGQNSSTVSVDNNHRAYYVQPQADGTFIRSGTATSLASNSSGGGSSSYAQPTSASITFEKSFNNPPLVFITASSGPIALNYMTQDGSGKFNGMSVVAASSFSNGGTLAGVAPYSGNTYTFSYFLVSDEIPYYGSPTNHGMRVYNDGGALIYDSSYFQPTFTAVTASKPYGYLSNGQYYTTNIGLTKSSQYGICLNNINSITGSTIYTAAIIGGSGFGPFSLFGRFLHVTSDTAATVSGLGACAIVRVNTLPQVWYNSFDYTIQNTPTFPVLFANYTF